MSAYDLQLTRYGEEGWRATFYPAGRTAHSQTSAVGSAWAPEPWVAVRRAAWERAFASARPSEPAYEPLVVTPPSVRVLKAMGN
jgi:hypothetical protein